MHGRLHDADGERNAIALAEFVPSVVLHVAAQRVLDVDELALHRSCEGIEHQPLVRVSVRDVSLELVVGRDRYLVSSLDFALGRASGRLEDSHVGGVASRPLRVVFSVVLAMKLELKTSDSLLAPRVVADDFHVRCLADVVLIAVEDNFRVAFCRAHAQEASDFVLQAELQVPSGEDESGSENVDEGLAAEGGDAFLVVGPVAVVQRRKLGLDIILNLKSCALVVACKQHARRKPVWQLQRERVRVLAGAGLAVNPV